MKIVHVADLHQGLLTHARPDYGTGIPTSILSVANCWRVAVDVAIEVEADLVVVAGDVFHDPNPDAVSIALFAKELQRLKIERIPVAIIAGNHDRAPQSSQPSIVEAFDDTQGGVFAVSVPGILPFGDAKVAALPSVSRNWIMAHDPTLSRSSAEEAVVDKLRQILDALRGGDAPDVLVGHYSVAGSVIGAEADIALIGEPMLQPADLDGFGYVAFGHIHVRQPIGDQRTLGGYSGSIDRISFSEERDAKGGFVVDLNDGVAIATGFDTPARGFLTIDWPGQPDFDFDQIPFEGIVRVRDVPSDQSAAVQEVLHKAGASVVKVEVARGPRPTPRHPSVVKAATPVDALDGYMDARDVPDPDRKPIRRAALELIEGGES